MLKNKNDKQIERLMNEKGYSHAEAMDELKKKDPNQETKGSAEEPSGDSEDITGDTEEVCLPANLLPEVSVGKEISFNLSGEVTEVSNDMVYVKTDNFNVSVREPFKDKGSVKGIAVQGA